MESFSTWEHPRSEAFRYSSSSLLLSLLRSVILKPPPVQLFDRLKLFSMPAKHQPDFIYLRHVPLRKVHLFTIIQLSCLVLLWVIKTSKAAIVFPMMVTAGSFIVLELNKLVFFAFS